MKKLSFCLVIAISVLLPSIIFSQAMVNNRTGKVMTLKSSTGNGEITIKAFEKTRVSFAPSSGVFAFDLYVYEGISERYIASFTKNVKNKEFQISDHDLTGEQTTEFTSVIEPEKPKQESFENLELFQGERVIVRTTKVVLKNSANFRIAALGGPFAGLALAPGQSSRDSFTIMTGQLEQTFKHDVQQEQGTETDKKTAYGRSYRQSVYSGIVVDGQKELEVRNENLTFFEGKTVKTMALSQVPFKFVFTAGVWKGQALSLRDYTQTEELNEGFNSLSIQYVGSDGLKYQADVEVIVTKRDRPLIIREADIKNKMRIKQ